MTSDKIRQVRQQIAGNQVSNPEQLRAEQRQKAGKGKTDTVAKSTVAKCTAAALRTAAITILEEQLNPAKASDYLNRYADAVLSHGVDCEELGESHTWLTVVDELQARELMAKTDREQS